MEAKIKRAICFAIITAVLPAAFGLVRAEPAMPDSIVRVGACRPLGWPWGVWVQGDYAYVATRSYLSVVNISNPSTPSVVTNFDDGSGPLGIFLVDTLVYINDGGWFTIVNVSDPGSPSIVGSCFVPVLTEPKGISVIRTNAYVAASDSGLQIAGASDPSSPSIIGRYHTPARTKDLFVDGSLAYLADGDSLQIIDVSDSTTPFRVGAIAMPSNCYDVFIVDTFAYVVCASNTGSDGTMQVVNVSDPSNAYIVNSVTMNGDPWAIYVLGSYAYVVAADYWALHKGGVRQVGGMRLEREFGIQADIEGGLRIVDISDPGNPTLVASYDTPGDPRDVFAVFPYVYVADYDSLQILRHVAVGVEEKPAYGPRALRFRLAQNQPNPFSGFTVISYDLPTPGEIILEIYDITGRLVRTLVDARQPAGRHTVMWNGTDDANRKLASGVYFSRVTTESGTLSNKMLLVR